VVKNFCLTFSEIVSRRGAPLMGSQPQETYTGLIGPAGSLEIETIKYARTP
jgi:hypothetical protein